jgi:ATP synthase protein I
VVLGSNTVVDKLSTSPIFRIVVAQFIATFLASASCLALDRVAVISALMAGIVSIVPGIYVLVMSLRAVDPGTTGIASVVKGEIGKFALTMSLFALVFVFVKPLDVAVFFGTIVLLQLCNLLVPLIEARKLLKR